MDFQGKKVLILEGYARQCLPFMRSFKKQGCEVTLLCDSKLDCGYASRLPDRKILGVCNPDRYAESEEYICNLVRTGGFDLVLPLVDFSAGILSENKEELSKYAVIASNEKEVFRASQDKLSVMVTCQENGIPCPGTLTDIQTMEDVLGAGLTYPFVVKPRRGCGARGFHLVESEEQLRELDPIVDWKDSVVQEFVKQDGNALSCNLYIDRNGEVKSCFTYASLRWYPLKGGTGTLNQMVDRPDVEKQCVALANILHLRGNIGIDLMDDKESGKAKVIEINPRILACSKIGFDAGIDLGLQVLQDAFGEEVTRFADYKKGIYSRMSQTDMIWFLKSPDRFRAKPSWFRLKDTKDQMFSWRDPLPWFAFLFRGMRNYKSEMNKRK